jgi:chloramphenicol-sensitive protein RarD
LNKGIVFGISAYLIWGFFPAFFKALQEVSALQIMFHRVVWSFVFVVVVILVKRDWAALKAQIGSLKILLIYGTAAVLLAVNWWIYIYGVNSGQVLETSLGYFLNPLINVAMGVVLLKEKLRPAQWVPVGMASAGVLYITLQYGKLPWIALGLAILFALYGLVKKVAPLGALYGFTVETAVLILPSLGYLMFVESQGSGSFGHSGVSTAVLLVLSGAVSAVPLLMFAAAARLIPLYMMGILQFIAPTCQFLLGVLAYHEPFTPTRVVGFSIIWAALLFYWLEGMIAQRRRSAQLSLT